MSPRNSGEETTGTSDDFCIIVHRQGNICNVIGPEGNPGGVEFVIIDGDQKSWRAKYPRFVQPVNHWETNEMALNAVSDRDTTETHQYDC